MNTVRPAITAIETDFYSFSRHHPRMKRILEAAEAYVGKRTCLSMEGEEDKDQDDWTGDKRQSVHQVRYIVWFDRDSLNVICDLRRVLQQKAAFAAERSKTD